MVYISYSDFDYVKVLRIKLYMALKTIEGETSLFTINVSDPL